MNTVTVGSDHGRYARGTRSCKSGRICSARVAEYLLPARSWMTEHTNRTAEAHWISVEQPVFLHPVPDAEPGQADKASRLRLIEVRSHEGLLDE